MMQQMLLFLLTVKISVLCPSFSTILKYTYDVPIRLFVTGEGELASTEETAQGDPLAMPMSCPCCYPMIHSLHHHHPNVSRMMLLLLDS